MSDVPIQQPKAVTGKDAWANSHINQNLRLSDKFVFGGAEGRIQKLNRDQVEANRQAVLDEAIIR